jgi:hypothetical protein
VPGAGPAGDDRAGPHRDRRVASPATCSWPSPPASWRLPGWRRRAQPDAGTGYGSLRFIGWPFLDPFFTAVAEATEEAVLNALIANEDMTGRDGHRSPRCPGPSWPGRAARRLHR